MIASLYCTQFIPGSTPRFFWKITDYLFRRANPINWFIFSLIILDFVQAKHTCYIEAIVTMEAFK